MHMMRLDKEAAIQALINRLNEAELYLSDYLGTPEEYDAIEGKEQQFKELQKALDKKSDASEKELARKMCYVITKHSRDCEDRAYAFRLAFGEETKKVAERLAERLNVPLPDAEATPVGDGAAGESDDVFGDDAATTTAARYGPISERLSDAEQSEQLAGLIEEVCKEIK